MTLMATGRPSRLRPR